MPREVAHWIELTATIILAVYFLRPRRRPPTHPLPANDARHLVRRLRGLKWREERWLW